ncbi:MAG: inositol monophosphatase family protein [Cyanobacteria bacterium J06629_9]
MDSLTVDQNERICTLVTQAGQRAKQANQHEFGVFEKGIEDYVTSVDQELDQYLSAGFADLFPQDGIVTEENQASCQAFQACPERLWLIDPIDGTEEFIHKGDGYAVMVGLLERYQPRAGWVYAPERETLYWGGQGWGIVSVGTSGAARAAAAPMSDATLRTVLSTAVGQPRPKALWRCDRTLFAHRSMLFPR